MTEFCWSAGSFQKEYKDIIKAFNEVNKSGLNAKIHVIWPYLEVLFVEGVPIAFKGDLTAFSQSKELKVFVTALSDSEVIVEMDDPDYIKVSSPHELLALIKEIIAREALVLEGKVIPVVHLFDPTAVSVDTSTWESFTLNVERPSTAIYKLLGGESTVINIVSLSDRWVLDILYCKGAILGASLSMPEQIGTITGADAFVYPLQSPGKWLVTVAKSLMCPNLNIVLDPKLEEKAKGVAEGVVKL